METIAKNNLWSPCFRAAHCLLVNVVLTLVSNRNHGHNKTNGVRELVTPPQVHSDALNPGVQHVQGLFLSFRLLSFFRLGPLNWRFSAWQLVVWNFGTLAGFWKDAAPNDVKWLLCWNSFSQGVVAFNSQFPTQTQVQAGSTKSLTGSEDAN